MSNPGTPANDARVVTAEKAQDEGKDPDSFNFGSSVKRKYRRHPKVCFSLELTEDPLADPLAIQPVSEADDCFKSDENAPERPPSAYVIFSNSTLGARRVGWQP